MKIAEILLLGGEILKTLHESGVKISDYKYVGMYEDYLRMRRRGVKTTAIVMELAERYGCSERFVYKLIKRFDMDCTIGSVG